MNARAILASAVALACAPLASASDWYFTGNFGTGWYTEAWVDLGGGMGYWANNWGQTGPTRPLPFPGSSDDVHFDSIGTASLNNAAASILDVFNVASTLRVENGGLLTLNGSSFQNTGAVVIAYGGYAGNGRIDFAGPVTLSGAGHLQFAGGSLTGGTLTQNSGHLIHGNNGYIDCALVNYGTVNSDENNGMLQLRGYTTNHGTIKASNNARIELRNTVEQSSGGVVHADGGTVYLVNNTIIGGTLRSGGYEIQVASGCTGGIRDVVNEGTIRAPNNDSQLLLSGSVITNNGRIISTENTGMGAGRVRVDSNLTLTGTGELWLRASLYTIGGFTLTNGPNHTIRYGDDPSGSGLLDVPLVNHGIVRSDYSGKSIVLCTNPKTNYQFIDATNGGTLDLRCSISQDGNARIRALGGNVYLNNATITGGHLDATPGFEFQTGGNSVNALVGVHNHAVVRAINNNSILALAGGAITNDGMLISTENTGMGAGRIRIDDDLLLTGSGELWCRAQLYSDTGKTLTNDMFHTIRYGDVSSGDGLIDVALVNNGVVRSDYPGKTIILRSAAKTNRGLIQATNGGMLSIQCPVNQAATGAIAGNGGNVFLYNASITGGWVDSGSGGEVQTVANSINTFNQVTTGGIVRAPANNSILILAGDQITNYGRLITTENTGMGAGRIRIDSNLLLAGSGELWCRTQLYSDNESILTNAATHTIRYGDVASGDGLLDVALVNNGLVQSDFSGKAIRLRGAGKTNAGTIETFNGGTLSLEAPLTQTGSGVLRATSGNVYLAAGSIVGGRLDGVAGEFQLTGNAVFSIGDLTSTAQVRIPNNNSRLQLIGDVRNDGVIITTENTGMGAGQLRVDANLSLTGTGELWARTRVYSDNASVLRNASGHTIRYGDAASGDGLLDVALLNEGTVRADYPGKSIVVRDQLKTNNGLMEATNGGILELRGVVITQPSGMIQGNGGNVRLNGAYVDRGTIASTGSSLVESVANSTTTFDNVSTAATIKMWNHNAMLAVRGTLNNSGTIELYQNTGMGSGRMQIDANNVEFHGSGKVLVYSEIVSPFGYTLVNGAGHTIGGTGWIRPPLVNRGILAPGASVGTLNTSNDVSFTPTGALHVELASASSYDRLAVGGNGYLDGSLLIELIDGFLPSRSNTFTVLTSSSRSGSFVNASPFTLIPTIDGLAGFVPDYTGSSVVLKNFTRLGDVNLDNAVNNQDIAGFVALLTGGGSPTGEIGFAADCNHDGVVNNQDIAPFVALLTGGRPIGDVAGDPEFAPLMNLVPEPASLSLLGLGAMIALRRRRR